LDARLVRAFRPSSGAAFNRAAWPATVPAAAQLLREGLELPPGITILVGETGPGAGDLLWVERGPGGRAAWAYFLRADTMHSLYTFLEQNPGRARRERLHELSHGQGFLEILRTRANQRGFYLMDEPDSPLSFVASLGLVALLHDLAREGSQVIVATHSPIVAAVPGARVLELGDWGIRPAEWADLEIVHSWRGFLNDPTQFLRHLLSDDE
jgi:predicted ATPase